MTERRYGVAVLSVFGLALGLRLLPLAWSPYPATMDGIAYAADARDALATGQLPLGAMRADNLVFTSFLATTGEVLGIAPLRVAQPAVAVVGAASVLAAMAIVRRFGRDLDLTPTAVRLATVLVGVGLAVDGLYLRRTGVPDEEALAFLFLPLLVLALHRGLRAERPAWLAAAGLFLVTFPLTHTFSTLVAGTTLVAWLSAARGQLSTWKLAGAAAVVGVFWGYFASYYDLASRLGFVVPYVDRVTAHLGLFLAWLVAMVVGVWWYQSTGRRARRALIVSPVLVMVAVVLANALRPVFPGTVASPGVLPFVLAVYAVPALVAVGGAEALADRLEGAALVLALLAAPVAIIGFSLTAALTPEFFGTAMRTQTFAHLPIVGLAAVGLAVGYSRGVPPHRRQLRRALPVILLASLAITAPVAYVDLDTLAFPSTTTESEFQAASFAAQRVSGGWTSDHVLTRIAGHYYEHGGAISPAASWLGGGPPPDCGLLSAISWTTSGAHLFPAGPRTVSSERYASTLANRNLVYSSGEGYDSFAITISTRTNSGC